jgi:3-dehydroquinate synthetase
MAARQNALLAALGLPIEYHGNVRAAAILSTMQLDKKIVGKRVQWIMPLHVGEVIITPMPDELVTRTITTFFAEE